MAYWYNVITKQVESDANRSAGMDLLGPYDTEEAARAAIEQAHQQSKAWDDQWADNEQADGGD